MVKVAGKRAGESIPVEICACELGAAWRRSGAVTSVLRTARIHTRVRRHRRLRQSESRLRDKTELIRIILNRRKIRQYLINWV